MTVQKLICVQDNYTLSGVGQPSYFIKKGAILDHLIIYNIGNEVVAVPPQGYFWSKIPDSPDFTLHLLIYYKTLEQFREDRINKVLC